MAIEGSQGAAGDKEGMVRMRRAAALSTIQSAGM
jgi:hypothetical protein